MYPVNEIFHSLQGEGYHSGTPAVFVRFSGCNLRCHFCDTEHQQGRMMTADEIVDAVRSLPPAPLLVLTGGEPSLFVDEELVQQLKEVFGMTVAIETNGTHLLPSSIDWITLSPKDAFDGGDIQPCILRSCNELKVVYTGQDLSRYEIFQTQYRFLQPCYHPDPVQNDLNLHACVEAVLQHSGWRLSLQVHRILGIK